MFRARSVVRREQAHSTGPALVRHVPRLGPELDAFEHVEVVVELLAGTAVAEPLDRLRERGDSVEGILVLIGDRAPQVIERSPQEPEHLVGTFTHVAVGDLVHEGAQSVKLLDDFLRELTSRSVDHPRQRGAADVRFSPERAHLVRIELADGRRQELRESLLALGRAQRRARELEQRYQHRLHRERPVLAHHDERNILAIEGSSDGARSRTVTAHDDRDVAPRDPLARAQTVALARDRIGLLRQVVELPGGRHRHAPMAARQVDGGRGCECFRERRAGVGHAATEPVDPRVGVHRRGHRAAGHE